MGFYWLFLFVFSIRFLPDSSLHEDSTWLVYDSNRFWWLEEPGKVQPCLCLPDGSEIQAAGLGLTNFFIPTLLPWAHSMNTPAMQRRKFSQWNIILRYPGGASVGFDICPCSFWTSKTACWEREIGYCGRIVRFCRYFTEENYPSSWKSLSSFVKSKKICIVDSTN